MVTPTNDAPVTVELPAVCDGKEQYAFEEWAKGQRFDMTEHPLHYLFLNERTDAARDGWKAGLTYASRLAALASAFAESAQLQWQHAQSIDAVCNLTMHIGEAHATIESLMTALRNPYHPAYAEGQKVLRAGSKQPAREPASAYAGDGAEEAIDAEVARIMAMSDEEIMRDADVDQARATISDALASAPAGLTANTMDVVEGVCAPMKALSPNYDPLNPLVRDNLARWILDGWTNGNEQWETASEPMQEMAEYAARAVVDGIRADMENHEPASAPAGGGVEEQGHGLGFHAQTFEDRSQDGFARVEMLRAGCVYIQQGGAQITMSPDVADRLAAALARPRAAVEPVRDRASGIEAFLAAILERSPNGETVGVKYHPNGDWSVFDGPRAAVGEREALTDICAAMEYWAGCDEGVTPDVATSEIMSAGGAWPATVYDKARAVLALQSPPAKVERQCPSSPDGRHQVDTSMESGPNNCFHCEAPMSTRIDATPTD